MFPQGQSLDNFLFAMGKSYSLVYLYGSCLLKMDTLDISYANKNEREIKTNEMQNINRKENKTG